MSGIVGLLHLDGRPVERDVVSAMSAALAHRGADSADWIAGSAALAARFAAATPTVAQQPAVHRDGPVAVMDGRIDNRAELLAGLRAHGARSDWSDVALAVAAYARYGDRFCDRLAGEYAIAVYDPRRRVLVLVRDGIGVRPLYYHHASGRAAFASEMKALLRLPGIDRTPNDAHIARYLLGAPMPPSEGFTFLASIVAVPPGHVITIGADGPVTRQYWSLPSGRIRRASQADYVEECRHLFMQAVERRLRSAGPVAVSLSGGVDSSSIYCAAETIRRSAPDAFPPLLAVSLASAKGSPSDEDEYLRDVERLWGTTSHRTPVIPRFLDPWPEQVWASEMPMYDSQWHSSRSVLRTAAAHGARTLLAGTWGDQAFFQPAYLVDLAREFRWRTLRRHLRVLPTWYPDVARGYFRRTTARGFARAATPKSIADLIRRKRRRSAVDAQWVTPLGRRLRQSLAAEVAGHHHPAHRSRSAYADALRTTFETPYQVLRMEWWNKVGHASGIQTEFPMLDRDLLSFLVQVPGDVVNADGVPRYLLRAAMAGMMPESVCLRRSKADFTYLVNEATLVEYDRLVELVSSAGVAARMGYVDGDRLEADLRRFRSHVGGGYCTAAWQVADLAGLEMWLQLFGDDHSPTQETRIDGHAA